MNKHHSTQKNIIINNLLFKLYSIILRTLTTCCTRPHYFRPKPSQANRPQNGLQLHTLKSTTQNQSPNNRISKPPNILTQYITKKKGKSKIQIFPFMSDFLYFVRGYFMNG